MVGHLGGIGLFLPRLLSSLKIKTVKYIFYDIPIEVKSNHCISTDYGASIFYRLLVVH